MRKRKMRLEGSMDFRTIRYEQLGAVLRITANRPEVLNAQSSVMILELDEAFGAASDDDETRVISRSSAHLERVAVARIPAEGPD